ncbi:MAG TPA: ubiquinol-cytochrome c reductase iron-sulfur subunit [Thermoanaerobaculia bacterium]|nr:ubiquinol-cytochrome c reductase iron-sulfur subunit [Thermoanaerobaculia bacterium]HUM28572.1 ubiquinol-cytochrome c reductase iron-sulfur subunit [Thermoanaerobaculia bacterium]HXK66820.1 ubiquinol-cytochrome c reductase iron-sulfur subunit [Thermoanaerobaculia bacterium]
MDSSRRSFLNLLLGVTGVGALGSIVYPVLKYLTPPQNAEQSVASVVAATVGELKPNSGKIFKFGNKPGILIMTQNGEYRAFSAICTHLNCTVQYDPEIQQIWCACHNGHFDLFGKNVSGPPPKPLESFDVEMKGENVGDEIVVLRRS